MALNALQHIGFGVRDTDKTLEFYRKLGFTVKLNDETGPVPGMKPVLGEVLDFRVAMVLNPRGGGVIETVEHKSSPIRPHPIPVRWGDLGYFAAGLAVRDLPAVYKYLQDKGLSFETPVMTLETSTGYTWRHAFLKDPDDLLLHLLELPSAGQRRIRGFSHAFLGVRDLERARRFFGDVMGFDQVLHEFEGHMSELDNVTGGPVEMRMLVLKRSRGCTGPFTILYGGTLALVQVTSREPRAIFEGRRWGDIGLMEIAFDVDDLDTTFKIALSKGAQEVIPQTFMDMGSGSKGRISYMSDPEGNLVEFVEVQKVMWMSPRVFMSLLLPVLRLFR